MIHRYYTQLRERIKDWLPAHKKRQKLKHQARRSLAIGSIATVIDFSLLNLIALAFGLNAVAANAISMTIATVFSYMLNRKVVFKEGESSKRKTIVPYILVTAVGLYGIQSLMIGLVVQYGVAAGVAAADLSTAWFGASPSADAWLLNIAKLIAGAVAGIWNFVLYRRLVFKDRG